MSIVKAKNKNMYSKKIELHPHFKTALSCLDLRLEAEVERYRQSITDEYLETENSELDEAEVNPQISDLLQVAPRDRTSQTEEISAKWLREKTLGNQEEANSILLSAWRISSLLLMLFTVGLVFSYSGLFRLFNAQPPATEAKKSQKENDMGTLQPGKISNLQPKQDVAEEPNLEPIPQVKSNPEPIVVASGKAGLVKVLLPPSLRTLPHQPSPGLNSLPTQIPPEALGNYYVLAEYTGDRSLQQAQSVVSNAYLGQFPQGIRIYLGSFGELEAANKLIEQLKQQGMIAFIYHPE